MLARMKRPDSRAANALRPIRIEPGALAHPEGSAIVTFGKTRVLVSASISESVPGWMRGKGGGWLTAEYAMHPAAGRKRQRREGRSGSIGGRTAEIQRLIGRSLRAAVDLERLGERTLDIDCDVLDADGDTRTASITGAFVATAQALAHLKARGLVPSNILRAQVAAVSVGVVGGEPVLDLCYEEDRDAQMDLNIVGTNDGRVIEVQGTAEGEPVERALIDRLMDLGLGAMSQLAGAQNAALDAAGVDLSKVMSR